MAIPTITKAEIKRFIKAQRNDRPVNMGNGSFDEAKDGCGCLMVHIGQSRKIIGTYAGQFGIDFGIDKGNRAINLLKVEGGTWIGIFKNYDVYPEVKTYGELKKCLID